MLVCVHKCNQYLLYIVSEIALSEIDIIIFSSSMKILL
jgi:hypothetical protein